MLKRSFSERGHSAHVKAFGVKVLPSTFQMPPLRVTGIDVKNPTPGDSTDNGTTWNGLPRNHYHETNGVVNNAQRGNGTWGKPSDRSRYINSHSFDGLDLEELTESERDLKIDYELGRAERNIKMAYEVAEAERVAEQEKKLDDVMGLDDILRMCTDYEQQLQRERLHGRQSLTETKNATSRSCSMTKIKTNGSLTSPVHIRRFAEQSKERHSNCQGPILLPPRTDWSMDTDTSQLDHRSSVEIPLPLPPDVLVDLNDDWTNGGVDQLSSTSSSEFLDKTVSPTTIRYQSLYENDDVFTAFQTDPSDCLNGDKVMDESPIHFPIHRQPLLQHFQPGSPLEVDALTRQLLPVAGTSCVSNDGLSDWGRNYENQKLNLELTRLRKMKNDAAERIGRTKNRMNEIDRLQEKVIQELEHELELVLTDSTEEVLASLRLEAERMEVIREQQMELLMEAAKEREEFQQQIETERRKLEALEAVHRDSRKHLESISSSTEIHPHHLLQTAVKRNKEAVDTQLRLFDDLEFSLLELETRREEEREPMQRKLAAELDSLLQLKSQREETLCLIEKQKSDVLHVANTDVTNLEKERYELMRAFKKERLIYQSIVDQLSRLAAQFSTSNDEFSNGFGNGYGVENGCGFEDLFTLSPSFSVTDDLCKTPPMKLQIRQILRNLEEEHQPMRSPPSPPLTVGVPGRGIESESSQEVNGDVSPTSKVFSSGSEDSSFNSSSEGGGGGVGKEGVGKEDETRTDAGNKTDDRLNSLTSKEEKLFGLGNSQGGAGGGGRGLARSMSEPRKTGRLELIAMDVGARTDDEIRLRDNYQRTQARPLTRYLPVRDKALDLRCFVESSGHSLDDTSQVLVSASNCCGYLKKQGGKFRTWHKRWFVFDRSKRCLTYFIDRTETKLRRSIYFQSIMDVFVDHLRTVVSPNQRLTFCLKTLDRRYYLIAPTAEAMRIWIDVLFTGAEGYQEFC